MNKAYLLLFALSLGFTYTSAQKEEKNIQNSLGFIKKKTSTSIPSYLEFKDDATITKEQLLQHLNSFTKDEIQLDFLSTTTDQLGITHDRYRQTIHGVAVEPSMYIIHHKNGKIISANGELTNLNPNTSQAALDFKKALKIAKNHIGATIYKWQNPNDEMLIKAEENDVNATYLPKEEFVYLKENNTLKLAYRLNIYANQPLSRDYVYIDALTGKVLKTTNLIHTGDVNAQAQTAYSGLRTITVDSLSATSYRLRETGRGNGIQTFDLNQALDHNSPVDFFDADNFWDNVNADLDQYATDAHWGAEMTYDYFFNVHNRNSIDGNGFTLRSYVHYGQDFTNAFWDGQRMTYGDGDAGSGYTPLSTMAIAGHEITHGLIQQSAGLVYQDESGALNESFADIFGIAIDFWSRPGLANWLMGDEISSNPNDYFRSMSNPNDKNDPDTYFGDFWHTSPSDNGGVHTNSGVQNFWFYLLCNGGTGTNDLSNAYVVDSLGILKASQIAFRNLTVYLTPSSTYEDARFYGIKSAIDLFGSCSPEVEATTNAWYAVGVGSAYVPFASADFTSLDTVGCRLPSPTEFTNLSQNGNTYFWDFGDGNTSTSLSPTHNYNSFGTFDVTLMIDGGVCGKDTIVKQNYVTIDSNLNCPIVLPAGGTYPTITACTGTLIDDGGKHSIYSNNQDTYVTIAPPGSSSVILTFDFFDVEEDGPNCGYDHLSVYDGNSTNAPLIGRYCNSNPPPNTINSSTGAITIHFHSDPGLELEGFEISWDCYTNPNPLADFDLSKTAVCPNETVSLTNNSINATSYAWSMSGATPATSTATDPTISYATPGNYTIELIAMNGNGNDTITKTIFVDSCSPDVLIANTTNTTRTDCIGIVIDDGGTNNPYSNLQETFVTISPTNAQSLTLNFLQFDIEEGEQGQPCIYDNIKLYNGTSTQDPIIGTYCNDIIPPANIVASSGSATVHFHADQFLELDGFILRWECDTNATSIGDNAYDITKVKVYPNPANDQLTIDVNFNTEQSLNLKLVNLLGAVVYQKTYSSTSMNYLNTIDVSQLPAGSYFLQVNNNAYRIEVVR